MSGTFARLIVPNRCVKFYDPHFNRSGEIWPEAIGGSIFDSSFYKVDNDVINDVICGVVVHQIGMDVRAKFGDSRSNRSWDIRAAAHFVMDERWTTADAGRDIS